MPLRKCCVRSCSKTREDGVLLYSFPHPQKDSDRFQAWVNAVGIDFLFMDHNVIHRQYKMCGIHFEENFLSSSGRLMRTAVPTLLLSGFYKRKKLQSGNNEGLRPAKTKENNNYDVPPQRVFSKTTIVAKDSDTNSFKATAQTSQDPKKVLQLRLLEDDECDEPIYEVLPEEQPESKVNVTTQIVGIDLHSAKNPSATEPPEVKVEVEECGERQSWKQKLAGVLHSRQFCGVCLSVCGGDDLSALSDRLKTRDGHCATYGHVLETVFKENYNSLANPYVCNSCTEKLIQSYTFIRKAEETWKTLNNDLDELYDKTGYIVRNSDMEDSADSTIHNVAIALDRGNSESFTCKNMNTENSKQSHLQRTRDRRKFKCLRCDLSLPSYSAWKIHAAATHGNDHRCRICLQSFKTRHDLTAHYRTHIKSRCPICHRTVQDGGLVQHLRKRHKHSVHLCSTFKDPSSQSPMMSHYKSSPLCTGGNYVNWRTIGHHGTHSRCCRVLGTLRRDRGVAWPVVSTQSSIAHFVTDR